MLWKSSIAIKLFHEGKSNDIGYIVCHVKKSINIVTLYLTSVCKTEYETFKDTKWAKHSHGETGMGIFLVALMSGLGFSRSSVVKNMPANVGDVSLIPELGSPLGEGNGNPLQYSCLGNPTDIGAWLQSMRSQKCQIGLTDSTTTTTTKCQGMHTVKKCTKHALFSQ